MACIKALDKAIQYNCELGAVGLRELYLINFADITAMTVSAANIITAITLKAGAKTVPVDMVKNGVKVVEAMKATEVSNGIDQTLTITLYDKAAIGTLIIDALMNGRFMAAVSYKDIKAGRSLRFGNFRHPDRQQRERGIYHNHAKNAGRCERGETDDNRNGTLDYNC